MYPFPFSIRQQEKIFLAQVGQLAKKKSLKLLEDCRRAKICVKQTLHKDSLASQLSVANQQKIKYVLILGQKEAYNNQVIIREMETGKQKIIDISKASAEIKRKLKK